MKKLLVLICLYAFSTIAHSQNIAPPVPQDSDAGNGHVMKTELKIDVKDEVDKIIVKHTSAHPKLTTKSYILKEGDPTVVRGILKDVIKGTKDRDQVDDIRVESIRYKGQDFTGVLVITAAEDRFVNKDDGGIPIPKLVEMLDQPLMLDLPARFTFQVYRAKHRPINKLKELAEDFILHVNPFLTLFTADPQDIADAGGREAYLANKESNTNGETKFGADFVFADPELNQLFIASAPSTAPMVREFLEQEDQPYENLHVAVTVYEVANKNELGIGNDFNAWKNANATDFFNYVHGDSGGSLHQITLQAELDAKYIDFLARKGKAKVYSSMNMVLRPNEQSTFDQRKIKVVTLPKSETITPTDSTAAGQVAAKVETNSSNRYYYGTSLDITPYKQGESSKLEINLNNISLVGFNDDASAKTAVSTLKTEVVTDNKGTKYVAGYLSRKEVVKSVSKVPLLGSIPYLGYLFSSEEDHTKTHQLVVIISCVEQKYDAQPIEGLAEISMIKDTVKGSKQDPTPRYDQWEGVKK